MPSHRPTSPAGSPISAPAPCGAASREATYDRVMNALTPDTSVFEQLRAQPEFTEQIWQYINRRCSDWRVITGKERAREYAGLLARIERTMASTATSCSACGAWSRRSATSSINRKYMRPVIPALAALAWGEPRRRTYWEAELLNALTIVDRGWAQARRHDRLLGRRHGPYPVDAGGLAAYRRRLRPRRPRQRRSASPTMRSPAPRAIWSSAENIGAAKPGAARSKLRPAIAAGRQPRWRTYATMASARRQARRRHGLRAAGRSA